MDCESDVLDKSVIESIVSKNTTLYPASLFFVSIEMSENAAENWFSSAFSIIKSMFSAPNICISDAQKEIRIVIFSSIPVDERMLKMLLQTSLPKVIELEVVSAGVSRSESDITAFLLQ